MIDKATTSIFFITCLLPADDSQYVLSLFLMLVREEMRKALLI